MPLPNNLKVYIILKFLPDNVRNRILNYLNSNELIKIKKINNLFSDIQINKVLFYIISKKILNFVKFKNILDVVIKIYLFFVLLIFLINVYISGSINFIQTFIAYLEYGGIHLILFIIYIYSDGIARIFNYFDNRKKINYFNSISLGILIIPFLLLYNLEGFVMHKFDLLYLFYLISSITYVPIIEELIFRRFIFNIVNKNYLSLIISSIMFSLAHNPPDIYKFFLLFFSSLFLGISYIYGGLTSSVISHIVANFLNLLIPFFVNLN